jgi:hypothetical protein
MLKRVTEDPFIPIYWGKNQSGMQAEAELQPGEQQVATVEWLNARDSVVEHVKSMLSIGVHKQITNRMLEPWLWHTALVTATEWDNFFKLRCSPMAQPEIRCIADMMRQKYNDLCPTQVVPFGEGIPMHLPLVDDKRDLIAAGYTTQDIVKISVGRCARVSYLTHDGKRDPKADIELYERLLGSGHMSPFEHVAAPMNTTDADHVLRLQQSHRDQRVAADPRHTFCGNLRGWVSHRMRLQKLDRSAT